MIDNDILAEIDRVAAAAWERHNGWRDGIEPIKRDPWPLTIVQWVAVGILFALFLVIIAGMLIFYLLGWWE